MTLDLTDDDRAVLAELLRERIERDAFPLSPRLRSFKAILAKLDPPAARPEPLPGAPGKPESDETAACCGHTQASTAATR